MSLTIKVPPVGESITEVTLSSWKKKDGDKVEMDEVIAELESDKATFELTAEKAGILKTAAKEGDTLPIGAVVATIEENGAVSLTNDTIDGNTSSYYGGGLDTWSGTVTILRNTLIAGNSAPYGPDTYGTVTAAQSFNNLIGIDDASGLVNGVNGNLVGTAAVPINPLLGPLQNNGGPTPTLLPERR